MSDNRDWATFEAFKAAREAVASGTGGMVSIEHKHLEEILREVDEQDELAKEKDSRIRALQNELAVAVEHREHYQRRLHEYWREDAAREKVVVLDVQCDRLIVRRR